MRPVPSTAAFALGVCALSSTAWARFDCRGLSLNGRDFDLSALAGTVKMEDKTETPPTVTITKYDLSLCSALPSTDLPPSDSCPPGTRLCMSTYTSRPDDPSLPDRILSVVPITVEPEGQELDAILSKVEGVDEAQEWVMEVGGGTYNRVGQRARFLMKCNKDAKGTAPTVTEYHSKLGILDLEWTTAAACPRSSDDPPPSDNNPNPDDGRNDRGGDDDERRGKDSGMGFFGWLFTLLVLGLIAYFVLGSYHNYSQYGATGWDMIPHRDLWRELPFILGDLVRPRGGSRAGYSSLG
ncbi:hypothetical protein JCM10212_004871 [Sporobolomyces blumeae]